MPIEDKPLPSIIVQDDEGLRASLDDNIVTQLKQATYSPSPLIRLLSDPTILPSATSSEYAKSSRPRDSSRSRRRPSRSPRREHRSEVVAAIAIAEEERQGRHLKSLLRHSSERLEHEIRRAEAASLRVELAERQEKEAVSRAKAAEKERDDMRQETTQLERDMRNYQIQLEFSQREMRRLQGDLDHSRREVEDLQRSETQAQSAVKKCQRSISDLQVQVKQRAVDTQQVVDRWFKSGREQGYDEGYEEGYEEGRKSSTKEGIKKGRKEGFIEGMERGKIEEKRSALERLDGLLSLEDVDDEVRTRVRQLVQSIYHPHSSRDTISPLDSGSVI